MVWALAGLMTITGSQCGAELAAMLPRAGGQYVYLREAYGPAVAFLFGWALFLIIQTGKIAAVAVAFATFSGVWMPGIAVDHYLVEPIRLGRYAVSLSTQQLLAIAVILMLTAVNTRGLKVGARIQTSLTLVKTAAFIGMIMLGLTIGWNHGGALLSAYGGIRRPMAGLPSRPGPIWRRPARSRSCCSWVCLWWGRCSRRPDGPM